MRRFRGVNFAALALIAGALVGPTVSSADGTTPASTLAGEQAREKPLRWQVAVLPAQAKPGDEVEVVFTADIASGWILYSSDFNIEIGPRPAKFTFDANPSLSLVGSIQAVSPKRKQDKTFGGEYSYFASHAEFRQKAKVVAPLQPVSGKINGQTCFEESGLCELFREEFRALQ